MHTKYFHLVLNKFFDHKVHWKVFLHSSNNSKEGLSISVSIPDAIPIIRTLNDCLPKMGINPSCVWHTMRTTSVTLVIPDIQNLIANNGTQQFIQSKLALRPVTLKDFLGDVLLSDVEKTLMNKPEGSFSLEAVNNKIIFSEIFSGQVSHYEYGENDKLGYSLDQALEKINTERGYQMPKSLLKSTFEFLATRPQLRVNANFPAEIQITSELDSFSSTYRRH